eukprot:6192328-Pleurochrysis_carterae.AAC.1
MTLVKCTNQNLLPTTLGSTLELFAHALHVLRRWRLPPRCWVRSEGEQSIFAHCRLHAVSHREAVVQPRHTKATGMASLASVPLSPVVARPDRGTDSRSRAHQPLSNTWASHLRQLWNGVKIARVALDIPSITVSCCLDQAKKAEVNERPRTSNDQRVGAAQVRLDLQPLECQSTDPANRLQVPCLCSMDHLYRGVCTSQARPRAVRPSTAQKAGGAAAVFFFRRADLSQFLNYEYRARGKEPTVSKLFPSVGVSAVYTVLSSIHRRQRRTEPAKGSNAVTLLLAHTVMRKGGGNGFSGRIAPGLLMAFQLLSIAAVWILNWPIEAPLQPKKSCCCGGMALAQLALCGAASLSPEAPAQAAAALDGLAISKQSSRSQPPEATCCTATCHIGSCVADFLSARSLTLLPVHTELPMAQAAPTASTAPRQHDRYRHAYCAGLDSGKHTR